MKSYVLKLFFTIYPPEIFNPVTLNAQERFLNLLRSYVYPTKQVLYRGSRNNGDYGLEIIRGISCINFKLDNWLNWQLTISISLLNQIVTYQVSPLM